MLCVEHCNMHPFIQCFRFFKLGAKVMAPQFRSGSAPGRLALQSESMRRHAESDRLRLRQESVSGNGQAGAYKLVQPTGRAAASPPAPTNCTSGARQCMDCDFDALARVMLQNSKIVATINCRANSRNSRETSVTL